MTFGIRPPSISVSIWWSDDESLRALAALKATDWTVLGIISDWALLPGLIYGRAYGKSLTVIFTKVSSKIRRGTSRHRTLIYSYRSEMYGDKNLKISLYTDLESYLHLLNHVIRLKCLSMISSPYDYLFQKSWSVCNPADLSGSVISHSYHPMTQEY